MAHLVLVPGNTHIVGRDISVTTRLRLLEVSKGEDQWVDEWLMAFFAFTILVVETGKKEIVTVPYDYDSGEWLVGAAQCALSLPVEFRPIAMEIVKKHDPFSCP